MRVVPVHAARVGQRDLVLSSRRIRRLDREHDVVAVAVGVDVEAMEVKVRDVRVRVHVVVMEPISSSIADGLLLASIVLPDRGWRLGPELVVDRNAQRIAWFDAQRWAHREAIVRSPAHSQCMWPKPSPTGSSDPSQRHHSLWPCRVGWQGRLPVEGDRAPKAGDDDVQCGLEEPIRARKRRRLRELGRKRGGSNKQCCQFSRHALTELTLLPCYKAKAGESARACGHVLTDTRSF